MARALPYNATLIRREEIADGLAIFHVELDEPLEPKPGQGLPFSPGQYLTIGLNRPDLDASDPRPLSVLRPMTIASAPEQAGPIEFYLNYVDKPASRLPLTHLLWDLVEGGRMHVRPSATGRFTAEETFGDLAGRTLVMIASGTGLAPFMSMLRSRAVQDPDAALENCVLLHGASNPSHLGYRVEIETLASTRGVRYLPTVSRPHEAHGWTGAMGRVEQLLDDDKIGETESHVGVRLTPKHAVVLVCGLAGTISGTVERLLARGFVPEHRRLKKALGLDEATPSLFFEQYDADPLFDFKNPEVIEGLRRRWALSGRSTSPNLP